MTDDLKPCPFCGAPGEIEYGSDHHGEFFHLGCSQHWGRVDPEAACVAGRIYYCEADVEPTQAIAAWNTRAGPSVQEAALIEWSAARKGATPASPEAWERLARAEGALQLLADAALRAIAEKGTPDDR